MCVADTFMYLLPMMTVSSLCHPCVISVSSLSSHLSLLPVVYDENNDDAVFCRSGNGKIEVEEFRHFMTTMGERMTNEEVEDLLRSARRDGEEFIEYKGQFSQHSHHILL